MAWPSDRAAAALLALVGGICSRQTSEDLQTFGRFFVAILRRTLIPAAGTRGVAVHALGAELGQHLVIEGASEIVGRLAVAALGKVEQQHPRRGDVALAEKLHGSVAQYARRNRGFFAGTGTDCRGSGRNRDSGAIGLRHPQHEASTRLRAVARLQDIDLDRIIAGRSLAERQSEGRYTFALHHPGAAAALASRRKRSLRRKPADHHVAGKTRRQKRTQSDLPPACGKEDLR